MYVCLCHAVTDRQIKQVVREGVCSLRQVQLCLRVGTNCGKCIPAAREIIDMTNAESPMQAPTQPAGLRQLHGQRTG